MTTISVQQAHIQKMLLQHDGFLPVVEVQKLLSDYECTIDQLVMALLPLAAEFAVQPLSHFNVGAIAIGDSGDLYFGANQEFTNLPISQVVHAEQAAIANAHVHGETGISTIAASARPCGHCRQFLYELAGAHQLKVMLPDGQFTELFMLLPDAFGPEQLGVHGGLLSASQPLRLLDICDDDLSQKALHAAVHSYAPYTKSYSGLALRTADGKIYQGSYLENVAFNPTLPALQSAFVHLVQSGGCYADVVDGVLVQAKNAVINHAAITEMLLKAVCPQAELQVREAE